MPLDAIREQPRAVSLLRSAIEHQRVAHAWLFLGPGGTGKEFAALHFAQALVCPNGGCGTCSTCLRVASGGHPDVAWVRPEEGARELKIDEIRALTKRLARRRLEAPTKVALIIDADLMNFAAQNALLKTLEEPTPQTVLILTTSAAQRLLPTLRSRCLGVSFQAFSREFVEEYLRQKSIDPEKVAAISEAAEGNLRRAEVLSESSEQVVGFRQDFQALVPGAPSAWLALAERAGADKASAALFLDVARSTVAAAIRELNLGSAPAHHAFATLGLPRLFRTLELIEDASVAIAQRNGVPRLHLERLFIEAMR